MPYSKDSIPRDHTEFGGGPGLIDPVVREDRALEPHQEPWEVYATNPAPPPEGQEAELDPQTATIGEVPKKGYGG